MAYTKTESNNQGPDIITVIEKLVIMIGVIFLLSLKIIYKGLTKVRFKSLLQKALIFLTLSFILIYPMLHIKLLMYFNVNLKIIKFFVPTTAKATFIQILAFTGFLTCTYLWFKGAIAFIKEQKYKKAFEEVSLKDAKGNPPKISSLKQIDPFTKVLKVSASGIGSDQILSKKSELEASFGENIESINKLSNPKYVEIVITSKTLPHKVLYTSMCENLESENTFLIGESKTGMLTQDITDLPHMMIAGTTGGGKSQFFKQSLLSLLKTTDHLKMYLIDLKGGLEFKNFSRLPNIEVAKDISTALVFLREAKKEMHKRFKYLETNDQESINPNSMPFNRIVIGVDEASVLFSKPTRGHFEYDDIMEARSITEEISKLGRAAAIHLILATQKVSKETIDTRIQENIAGRLCFKTGTIEGSVRVLGNAKASHLPHTPGRAIWQFGQFETVVQTPYLDTETLNKELLIVKSEYESGIKTLKQVKDNTLKKTLPLISNNSFNNFDHTIDV